MKLEEILLLIVRGWCFWSIVPCVTKKVALIMGPLGALLICRLQISDGFHLETSFSGSFFQALLIEPIIGIGIVMPFIVPIWIAEVVGGVVDISMNLTSASVVNPMAVGGSKGLWSTIFRQLKLSQLVLFALLTDLIGAFCDSAQRFPPGIIANYSDIFGIFYQGWVGSCETLMLKVVPILVGCVIIEIFVGFIGRFSAASAITPLIHLMRTTLGLAFVCRQ